MERQLVVFKVANEHYGVDIGAVEGIVNMLPITAIPEAPPFVDGVTNLRGEVLPVVDLRRRFDLPAVEISRESRIVVTEVEGSSKVGMIVDEVSEVLAVAEEAIEPPSAVVSAKDTGIVTGIAKADNQLVILLDLRNLLTVDELAGVQAAASAA